MKRTEQLEKTRAAILRTATRLFLQKGFAQTSTRDIAKEIGITQPALYHHFSDKEVLFLNVMTNFSGRVRQDINKVLRKHKLSPEDQLFEIVKVLKSTTRSASTTSITRPCSCFPRVPSESST